MKKCIWCSRSEDETRFLRLAHTFPQSLGGGETCENVCDDCNAYFGSAKSHSPAIEVVLKETLNLSKYLLLHSTNNAPRQRFKSEYFNLSKTGNRITMKPRYSIRPSFQEKIGRLFKRGLYKVFLEERERQKNDAHLDRYNFIREFARYDLNDPPVYLVKPKSKWVIFSKTDVEKPAIRFTEQSDDIDNNFRVFDYLIMGHFFCLPTSNFFTSFNIELYQKYLKKSNNPFGDELIEIRHVEDIDFTFRYLNE